MSSRGETLPVTYLFVPASRPDRLNKALATGADAIIADLEDAVDPAGKAAARESLLAWLKIEPRPAGATRLWVRVNALETPWFGDDLALLREQAANLAGVMLPKVEGSGALDALGECDLPVLALVESARGLLALAQIAGHARVQRLAFGAADLSRDLGCEDDWEPLLAHRASLVLHSAACGLPSPVDGVTLALDRPEVAEQEARRARSAGFGAKLCIHPSQLAPVARGFAPSAAQCLWAERVLAAAEQGQGAQRVDGQMIDRPVIERARQLLLRRVER